LIPKPFIGSPPEIGVIPMTFMPEIPEIGPPAPLLLELEDIPVASLPKLLPVGSETPIDAVP
jgi:hypothetical protein